MHRGPAGAGALNVLLQNALTPQRVGTSEKRYGDRVFRAGDKVIQLRNNYTKGKAGIFNGTVATATGLSLQEQTITVVTDEDEQIAYDFAELDERERGSIAVPGGAHSSPCSGICAGSASHRRLRVCRWRRSRSWSSATPRYLFVERSLSIGTAHDAGTSDGGR